MSQIQLDNIPRKRGRPVSGLAMSSAEKQKLYRKRLAKKKHDEDLVDVELTIKRCFSSQLQFLLDSGQFELLINLSSTLNEIKKP